MTDRHSASWARIEVVQRSKGQSAVARAAYHIAGRLYDERRDEWHDYSSKPGVNGVGVFGWRNRDPQDLWNAAEREERNRDGSWRAAAQTAREMRIAIPIEIPAKDLQRLLRGYGMWLHERYGVAVQVAVHEPPREGSKNRHVHILMSTRRVDPNSSTGFGEKARELDDRTKRTGPDGKPRPSRGSAEVRAMRDEWAKRVNRALDKNGSTRGRVDMRSHKERSARGEAPPKRKSTHLGPAKAAAARTHFEAVAEAEAAGRTPPAAPQWLERARRDADLNSQLQALWDEAMWQARRHKKQGEDDLAEELIKMFGGLVGAFIKDAKSFVAPTTSRPALPKKAPSPAAIKPAPAPAKVDLEDVERAAMRAEFDKEVDPEDPEFGVPLDKSGKPYRKHMRRGQRVRVKTGS